MDVSITLNDDIGNVKLHHTFNGAAPVGRGWMVCDGNLINEATYDALHGTGAYVRDNVAQSPIVGKNLPNMSNKFAIGSTNTSQNGSTAITSEGLSGHTLSVGAHNHKWYQFQPTGTNDKVYNSSGTISDIVLDGKSTGTHIVGSSGVSAQAPRLGTANQSVSDLYTSMDGTISQSIKPESIQFLYIIKVI